MSKRALRILTVLLAVVLLGTLLAVGTLAEGETVTELCSVSAVISDGIDLRISGTVSAADAERDVRVRYTFYGETTELAVTPDADGAFSFTVPVGPGQMSGAVVAQLTVDGEAVGAERSASVHGYCAALLADDGSSATLKNVASDVLRYGAAALTYVGDAEGAAYLLDGLTLTGTSYVTPTLLTAAYTGDAFTSVRTVLTNRLNLVATDALGNEVRVDGIRFTDAWRPQTFTDTNGDELSYSVTAYIKAMEEDATAGPVVRALHALCLSLESYVASDGLAFTSHGDGTCSVSGGSCTDEHVRIPVYSPSGEYVVALADRAFYLNKTLVTVSIPETVTSIGARAFYSCAALTSLTLPDSVISLGGQMFYDTGNFASLQIGSGLAEIADNTFTYTWKLSEITVSEDNEHFKSVDGNLYSKDGTRLVRYGVGKRDTEFTVPSDVTAIGPYAFEYCSRIRTIVLPEGLTSIGTAAFYYCNWLSELVIPASVEEVGEDLFFHCIQLTIRCEAKEQPAGWADGWNNDRPVIWFWCAHEQCTEYTSTIAPTCTEDGTYSYCTCLDCGRNLDREGNVIEELVIPATGHSIGTDNVCTACGYDLAPSEGLAFTSHGDGTCSVSGGTCTDEDVRLPMYSPAGDLVTSVAQDAFRENTTVRSVVIQEGVTSLGKWAFLRCSSLVSVTLPDTLESILWACFGETALQSVVMPDSVTTVEAFAFTECASLTDVTLSAGLSELSTSMFRQCYNLNNVVIPDSVTFIGASAFQSCASLTDITIPDSVTAIGSYAFLNCAALSRLTLPSKLTSIGADAFASCPSLKEIFIPLSVETMGSTVFYQNTTSITCAAAERPAGWAENWNASCPVTWGGTDGSN